MYPGGVREDGFVRMWSRGISPSGWNRRSARPSSPTRPATSSGKSSCPRSSGSRCRCSSARSFSDRNLHSRGSFRAFERAGSERKWAFTHRGPKWGTFYSPVAKAAQRRFFDHYLKGEENGMADVPPVRLEVREDRETVHDVREETEWPLARTEWTELFPAPGGALGREPGAEGTAAFETEDGEGAAFTHRFERQTELTGPMSVRLRLEVRGADDMNVFVAVDKYRDGRRVPFEGSYGFGLDHVAFGWLKVSLRDGDRPRPLGPGEIADAEVELPPSATIFRAGEELRLTVRGRWPWRRNPFTGALPAAYEPSPKATCVLRLGGEGAARLLMPVIP